MDEQFLYEVKRSLSIAADALLASSGLKPGNLLVLGASTSEVAGSRIGSASSQEIGDAIISTLVEKLTPLGIVLAVGCCEHLNRAVVIPRDAAERMGLTIVYARPVLKAGGACGTAYYGILPDPVMVETIEAHAGMDIGDTLIGMHLRRVAVPVRCEIKSIGRANLVMARTRPKYIGGSRAQYPD
jgi:uncharacterized protein (TIGR01440 family)